VLASDPDATGVEPSTVARRAGPGPSRLGPDGRLPLEEAEALSLLLVALGRTLGGGEPGPEVAMAFEVPEAVGAFADQVVAQDLTFVEQFEAFVDAVEGSFGPSAGSEVLRARAAEWRGDAGAVEQALHRALRLDPGHPVALLDAADLASARGRAREARRLLHHAGADDEPLARVLDGLGPTPPAPGRNQRCPCGSGRKYKHCCIGTTTFPLAARRPWLHRKALDLVLRAPQRRALLDVAAAFAGAGGEQAPPPEAVLAAACDPLVGDLVLWEGGGLPRVVEGQGALLPPDERDLLQRWSSLRHHVWQVESTTTIRDHLGGARHELTEAPAPEGTTVLAVVDDGGGPAAVVGTVRTRPTAAATPVADLLATGAGAEDVARLLGAHIGWTAVPDPTP
jgi:hypothetical protein